MGEFIDIDGYDWADNVAGIGYPEPSYLDAVLADGGYTEPGYAVDHDFGWAPTDPRVTDV